MADAEASDDAHAQWSAVCDYCDSAAEHYCKPCSIKLCSPCKNEHLSKKVYRHHEVVPNTSGVGPANTTQCECSNHPGERCQLYCQPCEVPVCLTCIVENHNQHKLMKITDAYEAIKPTAIFQLQTLSQNIRPRLQKELEELSKSEMDIHSTIADIEQKMKDSAQHIHNEVDAILAENMKEIQKIKDDTIMPLLQEKVRKTQGNLDQCDEEILSCDKHLRSADPTDLLEFMKQRLESVDMPTNQVDATQLLPSFTPGRISRENLQRQFGKLVTMDHTKSSTPTGSKSESEDIKTDNSNRDGKVDTLYTKHEQNSTTLKLRIPSRNQPRHLKGTIK